MHGLFSFLEVYRNLKENLIDKMSKLTEFTDQKDSALIQEKKTCSIR